MNGTSILFVAWQSPTERALLPVARIIREPRGYEFTYVNGVRDALQRGFRPFYGSLPAPKISPDLPAFLANRLMPRSRPDYSEHIARLGLAGDPEPLCVLARSEGIKQTDNLEVFGHPDFDASTQAWIYHGFCRGIRHVNSEHLIDDLRVGDALTIVEDVTNAWDARALLFLVADGQRIGYVPHTLIEDIGMGLQSTLRVSAEVVRVNPQPAPVQQRLLVRISVQHSEGFQPLATMRYQPIAQGARRILASDVICASSGL